MDSWLFKFAEYVLQFSPHFFLFCLLMEKCHIRLVCSSLKQRKQQVVSNITQTSTNIKRDKKKIHSFCTFSTNSFKIWKLNLKKLKLKLKNEYSSLHISPQIAPQTCELSSNGHCVALKNTTPTNQTLNFITLLAPFAYPFLTLIQTCNHWTPVFRSLATIQSASDHLKAPFIILKMTLTN